jgi:hypothetical protein
MIDIEGEDWACYYYNQLETEESEVQLQSEGGNEDQASADGERKWTRFVQDYNACLEEYNCIPIHNSL